jgi:hypothetical protein
VDVYQYALANEVTFIAGCDSTYWIAGVSMYSDSAYGEVIQWDRGVISYLVKPHIHRGFTAGHVVSRNEIYLGGQDGIFKWDGQKLVTLLDSSQSKIEGFPDFLPQRILKTSSGDLFFVSNRTYNNLQYTLYFWKYESGRFQLKDSVRTPSRAFNTDLLESDGNLYSAGDGVQILTSSGWRPAGIITVPLYGIEGKRNDMICFNHDSFYHWNGKDYADITPQGLDVLHGSYSMSYVLYRDDEIFMPISRGFRFYVLRGHHR